MRAVIQRVKRAEVRIDGQTVGAIEHGLLVLLGVKKGDTMDDVDYLARKTAALRIFDDKEGKMNLSLADVGGKVLAVSQFTLYGDTKKGNRPSFIEAAKHEQAQDLYRKFVKRLRMEGIDVETGRFAAIMEVELINHGPVTIIIDSKQRTSK